MRTDRNKMTTELKVAKAYKEALKNKALPLELPMNLSIYRKARSLNYRDFCEWFNAELQTRNNKEK